MIKTIFDIKEYESVLIYLFKQRIKKSIITKIHNNRYVQQVDVLIHIYHL